MKLHNAEAGFTIAALLCIITAALVLTAATVPVYQMQARRELEKELIFRGEEYIRAIQKYQRKYPGNYPPSIEDLLSRDGLRFLRRQYSDPVTGQDFRLITVNPDGSLTNALTLLTIPIPATGTGVAPGIGGGGGPTGVSGAPQRGTVGPTVAPSSFGQGMGLGVAMGNLTGGAGAPAGGQNAGGIGPGVGSGVANTAVQQGRGGIVAPGGGTGTGIGAIGGTGIGTGGGATITFSGNPGSGNPGSGNPGSAAQPNRGAFAPGGQGGGNAPGNATPMPQQIGPGIAGVASDSVSQSVMIYNTREKYNEWEFVAPLIMQQGPAVNSPGTNTPVGSQRGLAPAARGSEFGMPTGGGTVPAGGGQNPISPFTNPPNNPFTGGGQGQGGTNSGAPGGAAPRGQGR